ncbi:MAG: hypothetical protein ACK53J_14875, partial [Betaproteobacteria bacterium]
GSADDHSDSVLEGVALKSALVACRRAADTKSETRGQASVFQRQNAPSLLRIRGFSEGKHVQRCRRIVAIAKS